MTEEIFNVGHINCAGCERTIRTLLGEVNGMEQVRADYRTNTLRSRMTRSVSAGRPWWTQLTDDRLRTEGTVNA